MRGARPRVPSCPWVRLYQSWHVNLALDPRFLRLLTDASPEEGLEHAVVGWRQPQQLAVEEVRSSSAAFSKAAANDPGADAAQQRAVRAVPEGQVELEL